MLCNILFYSHSCSFLESVCIFLVSFRNFLEYLDEFLWYLSAVVFFILSVRLNIGFDPFLLYGLAADGMFGDSSSETVWLPRMDNFVIDIWKVWQFSVGISV